MRWSVTPSVAVSWRDRCRGGRKAQAALAKGITPIVCVGETLAA
jgi:hypothetical protein